MILATHSPGVDEFVGLVRHLIARWSSFRKNALGRVVRIVVALQSFGSSDSQTTWAIFFSVRSWAFSRRTRLPRYTLRRNLPIHEADSFV